MLVLLGPVSAQPSMPPKNFVLPDLSTVPGAVTFTAEMFDLSDSHYVYDGEKWMSLDVPEHTEASVSIKVPVKGSYTIVVDAGSSLHGTSSFSIQVDDTTLPVKHVPAASDEEMAKKGRMLMWPEVEIAPGAKITITGGVNPPTDASLPLPKASWSRMLLLPHNMGPGGPPPMAPPSPPPPPAKAG